MNVTPSAKSPTIGDIAKQIGVSKMTVSRALRGTGRVSKETVAKVKEAADSLGYRPNPMVQTLMAGVRRKNLERSANIAWVITQSRNEPMPGALKKIMAGGQRSAWKMGYDLSPLHIDLANHTSEQLRRIIRARGIRGAIFNPLSRIGATVRFPWDEVAMASIGRSLVSPVLHYTMHHYYHGMQRTLDEIQNRGYRRIALVIKRATWEVRSEYADAMVFQHYCLNVGTDPSLAFPKCDDWSAAEYIKWFKTFQPDAIIGDGVYRYDAMKAVGIPLERLGFTTLSRHESKPGLSGIDHPFHDLGSAAVDLVIAQIQRNEKGIPAAPKAILMEGKWIDGGSLPMKQAR